MRTTLSVAGRPRSFTVIGEADGPRERALVLVFHGSKQDGEAHRRFTGRALDQLALDGRAVIVYLDGYRGNWNDARAESSFPAREKQVDDVAFARAVIDSVSGTHRFDPDAVVGVGYSNGGQMVFRLLHDAPELLAGAVVVAATMPDRVGFLAGFSETSERSLPVVLVAGTADRIVPFTGGRMAWWARAMFKVGGVTLSAPATAEYFARRNGITTAPVISLVPEKHNGRRGTRMEKVAYRETGREPVTLYSVLRGGHTVPGPTRAPAMLGRTGADLPIDEIVGDMIDTVPSAQTTGLERGMVGDTMPVAVRATVVTRKRRSLIFGRKYYSFDVRFADGEVHEGVNIDAVLQGARYPADYWAVVHGAEAVAGDGVPGEWVDYPYGRPLRD